MDAAGSLELGENHRRVLSVILRRLDEMCEEIEGCLDPRPGRLWPVHVDLTPEQQEKVWRLASRIRAGTRRLADEIRAQPDDRSAKRFIRALVSLQIVDLEESDSSRLRGYGPLSERAAAKLDAEVRRLMALLGEIVRVVEDGRKAEGAKPQ